MSLDLREYEDQAWAIYHEEKQEISASEEIRRIETLSLITQDCTSILDLGCGNGEIINRIISKDKMTCGLDISLEALKCVNTIKVLGRINSLPFKDQCFDLVICCEVLEHLPFDVYAEALKEIERIAAKYIIITVPNHEAIKHNLLTCPYCGCKFHQSRHVRSFTLLTLKNSFHYFHIQKFKFCRPIIKTYPMFVMKGAKRLRIIGHGFPHLAICPQCGYFSVQQHTVDANINSMRSKVVHFLSHVLTVKKRQKGWIMALYHHN
ncbi:class I SAM-dependent methyltransferase [candidate division KSB1 bacterium]|nr:class I SAM-dependent methyltransferase [candidate division KSB1 bacterium]